MQERVDNSFSNQLVNMEMEYDEAKKKLIELMLQKNDQKGHFPNFPRINEMKRTSVLHAWKAHIPSSKRIFMTT